MSALHPVARVDELPTGGRKLIEVDGREIMLLNVEGTYRALDVRCPHANGRLGDGRVVENGRRIECPLHKWKFDLETGETLIDRRKKARLYAVVVDGDELKIRL
ncbi:MAG: Rieske (2Fe-2S) protein [Planctomycetota bacterium]